MIENSDIIYTPFGMWTVSQPGRLCANDSRRISAKVG